MIYTIKEAFLTLQGEGRNAGRRAVFLRFSGCNLWNGQEEDRPIAICPFCDTDFVGTDGLNGGRYAAAELADLCTQLWGPAKDRRFVVLTGGEPLLQVDRVLIALLQRRGFHVAVETNGTRQAPESIDWLTVSPKAGTRLVIDHAPELKLVYPQEGLDPSHFARFGASYRYLQPKWVPDPDVRAQNVQAAATYCLDHPEWQLGLQMHKLVGLP